MLELSDYFLSLFFKNVLVVNPLILCMCLHNLWLLLMWSKVWSESGSLHRAWLFLQWMVICTYARGSPCWTISATVGPPAWCAQSPADHFFGHLVPSSSAKWESPSLWVAPQACHWQQRWWYYNPCLQEYLNFVWGWSTAAIHSVPVSGITLCVYSDVCLFRKQNYSKY